MTPFDLLSTSAWTWIVATDSIARHWCPRSLTGLGYGRFQIVNLNGGTYTLGNLTKMLVVSQVDYLSHLSHLSKEPESLLRAKIVETLHNVIGDER